MKRPNGSGASGLLNPTGFGSTAAELVSTDTVLDCSRFNLKTSSKDVWGIDAEGIIVDKDGNFWICEEGGPTIWKLNSNGVVLKRFTPYANLSGAQPEDVMIDTVFKYRKNNRGFEGISITPNGKIYAIIQSPLLYPTSTVGENTMIHRILEIDPSNNATRMFAYLNDGIIGAAGANQIRLRDWKIGDMAAINDSMFLLIEHTFRGTTDRKNIYLININGATNVNSGLYGGKTLEALVDATGLATNSIKPVKKTLFLDLLANSWLAALDKPEALAIINDSTIVVGNDNDYGQTCPLANGIAIATTTTCHMYVYGLKGTNKIPGLKTFTPILSQGITGPSSSKTPYLEVTVPGAKTTSLITVGDSIGSYKMVGIPDGTGAFDNGNSTFTMLVNHELGNTVGVARAHGQKGAFVSKWVINKSDLSLVSGSDLIKNVNLWNGTGYTTYNTGNPSALIAFSRFCAGDLPEVSAFYNAATGLGTQERIFMNGEESGAEGRAFGHIATGTNAGTSYELPYLGKFSWENSVASPKASNKTIVAGMDDATPGQVYFYIGTKTNTGTEIEKAGLSGGKLFGVKVTGLLTEVSGSVPTAGTAFTLFDLGTVQGTTGAALNTASDAAGVTTFLRPEDGAWDPSSPADFYFVTTNSFTAPSRLWKLHFTDINNPEQGGTITAVLDGTEGPKMMDNLCFDNYGHIMIQEDPGGQTYLAKIWQYTVATDKLKLIAQHDATRFITGAADFLTQDEEASGIIDMQAILGPGMFLFADQAHYAIPGELVEGGQLLSLYNPDTYNASKGAGVNSSHAPYIEPVAAGVKVTALITAGDSIGNYKMAGIPDGTGAFDNGNSTFTLLVNHEIPATSGGVRAHGQKGALVSKWVINKSDLTIVSGSDLIKNVNIWNGTTYTTYNTGNPSALAAFGRFCSADLPPVSAFYNAATGLGTQERIFMNGEESGAEGRAFGHIATGANSGTTYELPYLGKYSWENAVTSPYVSNKTIVVGLDDATPGQVYFYIGTKTNTGTEIEKAGLSGGKLFGVKVTGLLTEVSGSVPTAGTAFTLFDLGTVQATTGAALNTASDAGGVTTFLRPEDGAWDPANPADFYFVTTNSFTAPSRLWKLHFTDINNPELGGTITAVLDGTEGPKMMDNICIDNYGHVLMQEDVGGNAHLGKTWQYTIATDNLKLIATHDATRFLSGAANFLTIDEEASGIIDMQGILGPGMFLMVDQAHYSKPGEIYEGGQILSLYNPDTYNDNPEINLQGNNVTILNGSPTPSATNNTDFGTVFKGSPQSKPFVIQNAGPGPLIIKGINFTGTNASEFTLVGAPSFPISIAANSTQTITDQFSPQASGLRTANINIVNNDFDENSYAYALQGNGNTSGVDDINKVNPVVVAPNPFDKSTSLNFELVTGADVSIEVYNILGERIQTIVNSTLEAGSYKYTFGSGEMQYPNGIYLLKVIINNQLYITRIIKNN